MDPLRVNHVRELCAGWVREGNAPSLCVLVARRGTIVLHEAFGVRRSENATPTLRLDSLFPVASCTKPLTASLVMCLVEDGLIGLNRPFVEYIPELDVPGVQWLDEARVADLLCHTSGIDDLQWGAFVSAATEKSNQLPPTPPGQHPMARRIALAAGAPLHYRPGTAMVYSNFGFNLLGEIVRRVSGRPLWQFAQLRLFEPLGMHDTSYVLPAELKDRRVYRGPGMPWIPPVPGLHGGGDSPEYDEIDFGCGGVTSTALDLAIFLQMLLNRGIYDGRRILSPATVATMTRPQIDSAIPKIFVWADVMGKRVEVVSKSGDYGYGLFIHGKGDTFRINGAFGSPSSFGHAGYGGPYVWADPDRDLLISFVAVAPRLQREYPGVDFDLFQNAVYGALVG